VLIGSPCLGVCSHCDPIIVSCVHVSLRWITSSMMDGRHSQGRACLEGYLRSSARGAEVEHNALRQRVRRRGRDVRSRGAAVRGRAGRRGPVPGAMPQLRFQASGTAKRRHSHVSLDHQGARDPRYVHHVPTNAVHPSTCPLWVRWPWRVGWRLAADGCAVCGLPLQSRRRRSERLDARRSTHPSSS
jgi:hypothetical protein